MDKKLLLQNFPLVNEKQFLYNYLMYFFIKNY